MNYFLTIAASDNSGGAGIQQDIKVANKLNFWPLSALTGITVQNFSKVYQVEPVNHKLLERQIITCLESYHIKAIKIGAICSFHNIFTIAKCLKNVSNRIIVLDPVLFSSDQTPLLNGGQKELIEKLFPLTTLVTPNKPEFELLTNQKFSSLDEAIEIAKIKSKEWNTSILLKGGHYNSIMLNEALVTKETVYRFERERKNFSYSHGTGCTISTAMACFLGKNKSFREAYLLSSRYLTRTYEKLTNL
jgi:hydroxymethylpyrimidine/phosphomethylpyrimidine kinase